MNCVTVWAIYVQVSERQFLPKSNSFFWWKNMHTEIINCVAVSCLFLRFCLFFNTLSQKPNVVISKKRLYFWVVFWVHLISKNSFINTATLPEEWKPPFVFHLTKFHDWNIKLFILCCDKNRRFKSFLHYTLEFQREQLCRFKRTHKK